MPHLLRSPQALEDLSDISRHIAQDNPRAALNWLDEMEQLFSALAAYPRMGEQVRTRRFGVVRRFSQGNYVLYFRPLLDGVEILRVVHGARDQNRLI
jgi:toxin ParE1/3/4